MKVDKYHYILLVALFLVSCFSIHTYRCGEKWKDNKKPTISLVMSTVGLVGSIVMGGYVANNRYRNWEEGGNAGRAKTALQVEKGKGRDITPTQLANLNALGPDQLLPGAVRGGDQR